MKIRILHILLLVLIIVFMMSCNKTNKNQISEEVVSTQITDTDKTISSIGEMLSDKSKNAVMSWNEYKTFDETIQPYYAISNTEALNNADLLAESSDKLKLSEIPEVLSNDQIKVRINILNSACLRLADMAKIPAIKPEEVSFQIKEVLDAYEMLKVRINSLFSVQELESELTLDPDFAKVLKETPETDKDTVKPLIKEPKNPKNIPDKYSKPRLIKNKSQRKKLEEIKK